MAVLKAVSSVLGLLSRGNSDRESIKRRVKKSTTQSYILHPIHNFAQGRVVVRNIARGGSE